MQNSDEINSISKTNTKKPFKIENFKSKIDEYLENKEIQNPKLNEIINDYLSYKSVIFF